MDTTRIQITPLPTALPLEFMCAAALSRAPLTWQIGIAAAAGRSVWEADRQAGFAEWAQSLRDDAATPLQRVLRETWIALEQAGRQWLAAVDAGVCAPWPWRMSRLITSGQTRRWITDEHGHLVVALTPTRDLLARELWTRPERGPNPADVMQMMIAAAERETAECAPSTHSSRS